MNPNGSGSSSSQTTSGSTTGNLDEYKRVDMSMHNQHIGKAIFDYGTNEQCHSLTWFKPNEKLFAACCTLHNTRTIKIYDPRGLFRDCFFFFRLMFILCLASPPVALTFLTKAPFNLCADNTEIYLAASTEVSRRFQ